MIYINRYNVEEEWEHYLQDYREYLVSAEQTENT